MTVDSKYDTALDREGAFGLNKINTIEGWVFKGIGKISASDTDLTPVTVTP